MLGAELRALGGKGIEIDRGAVRFRGSLEVAYNACLWSRIASRILLSLGTVQARDADTLYRDVASMDWLAHLGPRSTLAVDFVGRNDELRNTAFGARLIKDAIVDRVRTIEGIRPMVDLQHPDVRVHVHLRGVAASISIDLAGGSLHRRGWREELGPAPLKETLASAIIALSEWSPDVPFVDPMCGSGTLLVEAALKGCDVAPGLLRRTWGFRRWRGHDEAIWRACSRAAEERRDAGRRDLVLHGSDRAARALVATRRNAEAAGVSDLIQLEQLEITQRAAPTEQPGVLVTNPPYAERLGSEDEVAELYPLLGDMLKRRFPGWNAWIFTGNPRAAKRLGLRPARRIELFNGPIECRLLHVPMRAERPTGKGPGWRS